MNEELQMFENPKKPKFNRYVVFQSFLLRPFYLLLKKDMVRRLSEKHGTQFVDDVMATFGMPTNTTNE